MQFKYRPLSDLPDVKKQWNLVEDTPDIYKSTYGTIRIQSLEIKDFKGVKNGCIELYPADPKRSCAGKSNILALYGQNGTGKTAVVQALYLLKLAMTGKALPDEVHRLIAQDAETAQIKTVFEYRREGEEVVEYITYSFSLMKMFYEDEKNTETVRICDEVLTLSKRDSSGKLVEKTHKLFDTESKNKVLNTSVIEVDVHDVHNPGETWKERFQIDDSWQCFYGSRDSAIRCGASVLFYQGLEWIDSVSFGDYEDKDISPVYPNRYAYLGLLKTFAEKYLFIAGANLFNAFSEGNTPLYLRRGLIKARQREMVSLKKVIDLHNSLIPLNKVLSSVIPGLKIEIRYTFDDWLCKELNVTPGTMCLETVEPPPLFEAIDESGKEISLENTGALVLQFYTKQNDGTYGLNGEAPEPEKVLELLDEDHLEISFYTKRGDTVIPLADESEGIKHIIYELDLFIAAYNDPGVTAVIDEFDAGIFEYLLGEMLKTFEQYGKGQLIFTSHNLRPLEVLDRSFICFTTTNPENRYLRMKYINQTNNLRDVYYRQILVGEQDEDLYDYVDSFELKEALDWAGEDNA